MHPQLDIATPNDASLIRHLAERIWFACYPGIISPAQIRYMIDWMYAPHKLAAEIRQGIQYRIVRVAGEPAGYVAWEFQERPEGTVAHLNKLYLLPELHGHGLGQELLSQFLEAARRGGALRAELRVNRANTRAQKAYERAGFHNAGSALADIGAGFVMDDFIFQRPISPGVRQSGTDVPGSE